MTTGNEQALATLMCEYKAVRDELVATMGHTRQLLAITFTAIGAVFAGAVAIRNPETSYLFLAAALFFYGLACTYLRYMVLHINCENHICRKIVGPVQRILKGDPPEKTPVDAAEILTWEREQQSGSLNPSFWQLPIVAAPVLVQISAALLCNVVFICTKGLPANWFEWILLGLSPVLLVFVAVWAYKIQRRCC